MAIYRVYLGASSLPYSTEYFLSIVLPDDILIFRGWKAIARDRMFLGIN